MMIKQTMLSAAIALGLAMATQTATAAEGSGFYFGGSLGQATVELDSEVEDFLEDVEFLIEEEFNQFGTLTSVSNADFDDKDTSWSLFAGYAFNPYIAIEAGYVQLGTSEYKRTAVFDPFGPAAPGEIALKAQTESSGFTLAAVGSVPLGEAFDLHARLGMLAADTEISVDLSGGGVSGSIVDDEGSSESPFYGLGVGFNIGENLKLSLDYTLYNAVGDEDATGENDIDNLSLSLIYRL